VNGRQGVASQHEKEKKVGFKYKGEEKEEHPAGERKRTARTLTLHRKLEG